MDITTYGFIVTTSDQLNAALTDARMRPLFVAAGMYDVEVSRFEPGVVMGGGESITHLNFRVPPVFKQQSHWSHFHMSISDGMGLNVTNAAMSSFSECILTPQGKSQFAIISDRTGDNDNSYGIALESCHFMGGFRYAVLIEKNTKGRVNGWKINETAFDRTECGIYGEHMGGLKLTGGIFQVCTQGALYLHGHGNIVNFVHFERNGLYDIKIGERSQGTRILCDAKRNMILDDGIDTDIELYKAANMRTLDE